MEGFKQCPNCQCTDVPINAEMCPFCGHLFGKQQKARSTGAQNQPKTAPTVVQNQPKAAPTVVQNQPKTPPTVAQNRSEAKPAVKREEPVAPNKGGSGENKASAAPSSTEYKAYKKKEKNKHGFLKFVAIAAVLAFVWFRFMKPSLDNPSLENLSGEGSSEEMSEAYQGIGKAEGYFADSESTEPGSQMADGEDEWMGESGESLEMDSEEMLSNENETVNPQYILPLSDQVYLTREDIEGLSAEELRIARNEIYARHGRLFRDEALQAYFNSCDWYVGSVSADDFSDSVFNEYEMANKDLIVSYEHELGVNGQ